MNLNENDKNSIIELIKAGEKLPKEFIYKLFADEEDVFLFWNGRREEVTNIALPFHSIEHIDEPREEVIKSGEVLSMFDSRGRQLEGWTNKLIWGDNKLVLSSLINGPLRDEIEREGGLKLIYIDPPFAVGADFGFDIQVGGDSVEKKQSVIEEIAYRDTWGKGISSYLTMMYERLKLMHSLLAEDGSIYVHCDWRVNSHIRLVLDDVFGSENFLNEIIWRRRTNTVKAISNKFSINTDTIFLYTRQRNNYLFNIQYGDYPPEYYERFKYEDEYGKFYWNVMATYSQERLNQLQKEGKVKFSDGAKHPRFKQYLHELKGRPIENVWDDVNMINAMGGERLAYPTQKPEALLERIIKASSNEGDLIADFFSGSGTTAAVAEKLGRKWIATDLGRFAIHTARKRLIGVQRELQKNDKNFRAFEILNLGKYERQFFINDLSNGTKQEDVYLNLILEAYKAKRIAGHTTLHGSK
ncbi:MAG: site-specific DNA-methyltransferase, partial [Candidatus Parabeggiatoa sp. nov. 3]